MAGSLLWVRKNGQAEMRDNVRTAIKTAGTSQSAAAKQAGVKYNHLIGFLNGNNWFSREAAEAIAKSLEVAPEELIGNSIFKEDRSRYAEFNSAPPEVQQWREEDAARRTSEQRERAEAVRPGSTRALCCVCGALRTCTERSPWDAETHKWAGQRPRVTRELRCLECRETTLHALLRTDGDRDLAERLDHAPTRDSMARKELTELIDRLAGFNIDVHFNQGRPSERDDQTGDRYVSSYGYDRSKSRWRIEVDPAAPARLQVLQLQAHWKKIATGDFGDIDWDPKEGTICRPGSEAWGVVADELIEDVTRFLSVERRKLVQRVNDDIARHGATESSEGEVGA